MLLVKLSDEEVNEIKDFFIARVDEVGQERIEQLLSELRSGERTTAQAVQQINYVKRNVKYKKKLIRNIEAHGKPALIMSLLCSVPKYNGAADTSCGGSFLGVEDNYWCDSSIALDNLVTTLYEMGLIQYVDAQDLCRINAENVRECDLTDEYMKECRRNGERWTCNSVKEDEAVFTACLLDIILEAYTSLGVVTIVMNAGGVSKGTEKIMKKLNQNNVCVFIRKLWHIQFFNRFDNPKILDQVCLISRSMTKLRKLLVENSQLNMPQEEEDFEYLFVSKVGVKCTAYRDLLVRLLCREKRNNPERRVFSPSHTISEMIVNYAFNNEAALFAKYPKLKSLEEVTFEQLHRLMYTRGYDAFLGRMTEKERRKLQRRVYREVLLPKFNNDWARTYVSNIVIHVIVVNYTNI